MESRQPTSQTLINRINNAEIDQIADHDEARQQSGLSDYEFDFLKKVIANSRDAIDPKSVKLKKDRFAPNFNRDVYLATVSTSLNYDSEQDPNSPLYQPKTPDWHGFSHFKYSSHSDRYTLFDLSDAFSLAEFKSFHRDILQTLTSRLFQIRDDELKNDKLAYPNQHPAYFALLPEFSFPFPMSEEEASLHIQSVRGTMNEENKHYWESTYIISGTQHSYQRVQNLAVVDLPYRATGLKEQHSNNLLKFSDKNGASEEDVPRDVIFHPKFSPASKIGERLRPGWGIDWHYYDTAVGRIGVLICYDTHDVRMMLRLASQAINDVSNEEKFTMIFVPSYSENDKMRENCRILSGILNCMIIYSNAQYKGRGDRREKRKSLYAKPRKSAHGLFFNGHDFSDGVSDYGQIFEFIESDKTLFNRNKDLWWSHHIWRVNMRELVNFVNCCTGPSPLFKSLFEMTTNIRGT